MNATTPDALKGLAAGGFPPSLDCQPPVLAWWELCFGFLTRAGRTRRCLARAWRVNHCPEAVQTVAAAFAVLASHSARAKPALTRAAGEILTYLTWNALRVGDLVEARRWLRELDRSFGDLPARVPLRWQLLDLSRRHQAWEAYAAEAAILFADRHFSHQEFPSVLTAIVTVLFEDCGEEVCERVLTSARADIQSLEPACLSIALCRCPAEFGSREDALAFALRVPAEPLAFSPLLASRAWTVAARASEWRSDWSAMATCSHQALALAPGDRVACYWYVRALLHGPTAGGWERPLADGWQSTSQWQRLSMLCRLKQSPTVSQAEESLKALTGELGTPDALEQQLALTLFEKALTSPTARGLESLKRCAELCLVIQKMAGPLTWLEINLALKAINLDSDFAGALGRLERLNAKSAPELGDLIRVARVLTGAPKPASSLVAGDALVAIECALHRIAGRYAECSLDDDALALSLREARDHAVMQEFPSLADMLPVLEEALSCVASGFRLGGASLALARPEKAPAWLVWLCGRVAQIQCDPAHPGAMLATAPSDGFQNAWCLEGWWRYYGVPGQATPEVIRRARALLEPYLGRLAPEAQGGWRRMLAVRDRADTKAAGDPCSLSMPPELSRLGALFDAWFAFEVQFEMEFCIARESLRNGQAGEAWQLFRQLDVRRREIPALAAVLWAPLVSYWVGVAAAKAGRTEATDILSRLVDGPKGSEARAQLAMVAMQRGDLETADQHLANLEPQFPGVLYACGVLAARRGKLEEARQLAESYEARFGDTNSSYRQACIRLRAALLERTGHLTPAVAANGQALERDPGDAIATARLMRLRLREAYAGGQSSELTTSNIQLLQAGARAATTIPWCEPYGWLFRLVGSPGEVMAGLQGNAAALAQIGDTDFACRQVLTIRLLEQRRADEAWNLEAKMPPAAPAWYRRTRILLRAHSLLKRAAALWHTAATGAVSPTQDAFSGWTRELQECERDLDDPSGQITDQIWQRWRFLIRKASELKAEPSAPMALGVWSELLPWPFAHVPALWAAHGQEREQAAQSLAAAIESPDGFWQGTTRELLLALSCWVRGADGSYLDHYATLEPVLSELPVDCSSLWLAAASAWFSRNDWTALLEGHLPDCVADLARPDVRLVISLAYARAAAEEATKGDGRSALRKIEQARSTLQELVI